MTRLYMANETLFGQSTRHQKNVTLGKSSTKIALSSEVGGTTSQLFTSCLAVSSTKQVKKSKRSVDK